MSPAEIQAEKTAAWQALASAAVAYASDKSTLPAQRLADAAERWSKAKRAAKPGANADDFVVPFGRSKGTPIADAKTNDLEWVAGALRKSIDDPEKERWRESNQVLLSAIESELEGR